MNINFKRKADGYITKIKAIIQLDNKYKNLPYKLSSADVVKTGDIIIDSDGAQFKIEKVDEVFTSQRRRLFWHKKQFYCYDAYMEKVTSK